MADFCEQCARELWGDYADMTSDFKFNLPCNEGEGYEVLCEGCGITWVNEDGKCLGGCAKGIEHANS